MRPIKFRIWDREAKKIRQVNSLHLETDQEGEWCVECYGKSYVTNEGDHDAAIDFIRGHNFELMQFTGLHDKNGKEIWEGDLIRSIMNGQPIISEVFWVDDNAGFCNPSYDQPEVIGNIYENGDLLK